MQTLQSRLNAALAPRYIVEQALAAGGMGQVFLARDPTLGRDVAIKVLPPERASAVAVERFLREARLLARLAHPHIVTIVEAQQDGDLLWYIMPRMTDGTLGDRIRLGRLPAAELRRVGLDLLSAVDHAHRQGVIHRDIKPANVFMQNGRALLADFGVAQLAESSVTTLTGPQEVVGTRRYMAPEQLSGDVVTERSDLYAAAATLFEAATGRPFDPAIAGESRSWRGVSRPIARAIRRALSHDPARRWSDATSFRRALARRAVAGWGAVAALGVVAAGALWLTGRVPGPANPAPRDRVGLVVLPFGSDSEGSRLARYTSMPLEFLPPITVFPWVRSAALDMQHALAVARNVVTGTILAHPGADTLDIVVYDSAGPSERIFVRGSPDRAAQWGRDAAAAVLGRLFPEHLTEFRELAGTGWNRPALDAYYDGQLHFQAGDWAGAERLFQRAEALDPPFPQATWGRLLARQWQRLPFEDELKRLASQGDSLTPALRELVRLQLEPDIERRIAGFAALARRYPDYGPVREVEANELFSRGPLAGHPLSEGIDAFRQAASELPVLNQPTTFTMTAWGADRIGDRSLASDQLDHRHAPPGDQWSGLLWLADKGRFQRWLAVPARMIMLLTANSSRVASLRHAVRLGLEFDNPWDQFAIASWLDRHAGDPAAHATALAAEATALLLVGKPMAALQRLNRATTDTAFGVQGAEWRVLLPLIPAAAIPIPATSRDSGRAVLRAVPRQGRFWIRAAWALSLDAIDRGDRTAADSLIAALRDSGGDPMATDLASFADAVLVADAGRYDSALTLSDRIHLIPNDAQIGARGPMVRAMMYLFRGYWRLRQGDLQGSDAEWIWHENNDLNGWPSGEPQQGELDAALSGVARLLRAENLMTAGDIANACRLADRVAQLWGNAEAEFDVLRRRDADLRDRCRR